MSRGESFALPSVIASPAFWIKAIARRILLCVKTTHRKVAVAFLAHPDDAEILCAGTLIRLIDNSWNVHIITATRGDCGSMTKSAAEISAIRTKEAEDAATVIG